MEKYTPVNSSFTDLVSLNKLFKELKNITKELIKG